MKLIHLFPVLALALVGPGASNALAQGSDGVVARVNDRPIASSRVTFVLQQQRDVRPEQASVVAKDMLERLIDQELALQRAAELRIDSQPRVLEQIEAARREIVARAYIEQVGEAALPATAAEIKKYYDDQPELFMLRRVYSLQEIAVKTSPEQVAALREKLAGSKTVNDFLDHLKAQNIRYTGNQVVRAAEQLPLASVAALAKLKDGQAMIVPAPDGAQVVFLNASRLQPVTEEQARPAIAQFILNERKRRLVEDDVRARRAAARIEYVGELNVAPAEAALSPATTPATSTATSPARDQPGAVPP